MFITFTGEKDEKINQQTKSIWGKKKKKTAGNKNHPDVEVDRLATPVESQTFLRESTQPRGWIQVSCIAGRFFITWANREAQESWSAKPIPLPADLPDPGNEP